MTPEKREELKSDIAKLQPEVKKELAELGQLRFQVKTYEENKDDILLHGNLSFTINEIIQTKKTYLLVSMLQFAFSALLSAMTIVLLQMMIENCTAQQCVTDCVKCKWWFHQKKSHASMNINVLMLQSHTKK